MLSLVLSYEFPKKPSMPRLRSQLLDPTIFCKHTQPSPTMSSSPPILVTNTQVHTKPMHVSTHAHRQPCTCKRTLPPSECPAAYPSSNRSTYCREDALAAVGQVHAVLRGQAEKMSRKNPQNPAFSSASYLPAPGLVEYWGKIQPRTDALCLCRGLHLGEDTLKANDFPKIPFEYRGIQKKTPAY